MDTYEEANFGISLLTGLEEEHSAVLSEDLFPTCLQADTRWCEYLLARGTFCCANNLIFGIKVNGSC